MNLTGWIGQRRDAAIDTVLGAVAPATPGIVLASLSTVVSLLSPWLPGLALIALASASWVLRSRVEAMSLPREGGTRERVRLRRSIVSLFDL
jgi:hypothetical protein